MQFQMVALCNACARHYSLFLAFSDADSELDFVLMTIEQRIKSIGLYLKDSI